MGVVTQITPDGDMYVRFDDEQGVQIYSGPEANALVYAWAMTVHKSQGGGYNVVVMAIHDEHNPMLYRTILYTGVTRAKDMVILVGTRRAIRRAITTPAPYIRRTSLAELV
jgi:exodeoxyribonuclease V alpha subunit